MSIMGCWVGHRIKFIRGGSTLKIKRLILENFRGYKEKTEITFEDLTALVGKNDAGKSTILETLDIFLTHTPFDRHEELVLY